LNDLLPEFCEPEFRLELLLEPELWPEPPLEPELRVELPEPELRPELLLWLDPELREEEEE